MLFATFFNPPVGFYCDLYDCLRFRMFDARLLFGIILENSLSF